MKRKYLPTLSELVDRLSIVQLKEVFIAEHKDEYSKEIADITHDIQDDIRDVNGSPLDVAAIKAQLMEDFKVDKIRKSKNPQSFSTSPLLA